MDREELFEEMKMPYEELQWYLKKKYGSATVDYFHTSECKSKNRKVSRIHDGLYCHHMDEDKGVDLGSPSKAKTQPFEWQKKERLVYCNSIEHLILHMKIAVLRQKEALKTPSDVSNFFTTQGVYRICEAINDMYMNNGTDVAWKRRCFEEIKENYTEYISIINSFINYINSCYIGDKSESPFLVPGSKVHFYDGDGEIVKVSDKKDRILLKFSDGEEHEFFSEAVAYSQLTFNDEIDLAIRKMSSGYDSYYAEIYADIRNNNYFIAEWEGLFRIDFHGYGFPQYANIILDSSFGANNADEYISSAFPMYCSVKYDMTDKTPVFWSGPSLPKDIGESFFIVRINTSFRIRKGMDPFVRYKPVDFLRSATIRHQLDDQNNLRQRSGVILETSDIYDKNTNKYYSKYIDLNGNTTDARVVLSLGKDDYLLFLERYCVRYLEILDGCYFR